MTENDLSDDLKNDLKARMNFENEFEREHVFYEFIMLGTCYEFLGTGKTTYDNNLYHEGFCVHAYNLMTYLEHIRDIQLPFHVNEIIKYKRAIEDQILTLKPLSRTTKHKLNWGGSPSDHDKIVMIVNELLEGAKINLVIQVKESVLTTENER